MASKAVILILILVGIFLFANAIVKFFPDASQGFGEILGGIAGGGKRCCIDPTTNICTPAPCASKQKSINCNSQKCSLPVVIATTTTTTSTTTTSSTTTSTTTTTVPTLPPNITYSPNLVSSPSFEGSTWQIDANNYNFQDWDISRSPSNGAIKSWVETINTHSGAKAFHWSASAPDPTNISFSYSSNKSKLIPINESNYLEGGSWAYVISGSTGSDISFNFYSPNGTFLGRFWGNDKLGGWALNEWRSASYLWYPSSLGSGDGFVPKGAAYAKIIIYNVWHTGGAKERIEDDVFVRQYDHLPNWIERTQKNFTNLQLSADFSKFQKTSSLSYGIAPTDQDIKISVPGQSTFDKVKSFNLSRMRFQFGRSTFSPCALWNATTNSCDTRITNFENWTIYPSQDNGYITTWLETTNTHSGSKAFHHYLSAPNSTNISFDYDSQVFPIDETKYYEAGFWSYPIQGTRTYDVSLRFYDQNMNVLSRRWGQSTIGSFSTNVWSKKSSLWYPSSLGQGDGYIEKGAKYAKLIIYVDWHTPGVKEAIDDDVFARMFTSLPTSTDRQSTVTNNLISNPSFEGSTSLGHDWTMLDKMLASIKGVGAEPVISLPIGTWGNGNYLPNGMPLNYSLWHEGSSAAGYGYFPTLSSYCEYTKAIVQHTNIDKGFKVKYWEIGNEPDVCNSTIASAYIDYFNLAESCMHQVDPTILLTSDESFQRVFVEKYFLPYAKNVGFLSFHNYDAWGNCMYPSDPSNPENIYYPPNDLNGWHKDETIMYNVNHLSESCNNCWCYYSPKEAYDLWKTKTGKDLEIIATEVNLNSVWQNGTDDRQNDVFGAAWYAAKIKAYISDGSNLNVNYFVLSSWDNDLRYSPMSKYGGFGFGMMNSSYPYNPYAPYWTNYLLTKYVPKGSSIYYSSSSDSDLIDMLAVKSGNSYNILLINKIKEPVGFNLNIAGLSVNNLTLYLLDKTTYIQKYEPSLDRTMIYKSGINTIQLPPSNSLNFIFNGYTVALLQIS
jgi:hypothetical protein